MLLEYGEHGLNAPRFADIRRLGESVFRTDDVFAQTKSFPALPAIGPWRVGLHPVQQRQAQLLRLPQILGLLLARSSQKISQPEIVLRPVDEGDVARIGPGREIR